MDFLTLLEKYEKEDVSKVKRIVKSNKAKEDAIIKEAFNSEYPSKKEALFNIDNYFINESTAPKSIDVSYVKEHINTIKSKIDRLDEGDIRIIIHNHEASSKGGSIGFEEESVTSKGKRGRPKKVATGVVYDKLDTLNDPSAQPEALVVDSDENLMDDDMMYDDESSDLPVPTEDDIVADVDVVDVNDEDIIDDALPKEELTDDIHLRVSGKPTKLRWSDLVKKVDEQEEERNSLIDELAEMNLDEEELKTATNMAKSGEIIEDDSRIGSAATIIGKINNL